MGARRSTLASRVRISDRVGLYMGGLLSLGGAEVNVDGQAVLAGVANGMGGAGGDAIPDGHQGAAVAGGVSNHLLIANRARAPAVALPFGGEAAHSDASGLSPGLGQLVDAT